VLQSVEIRKFLTSRAISGSKIGLCAQNIIAGIILIVQENDNHWISLAVDQSEATEGIMWGYLKHSRESLLLANLIHITRQILQYGLGDEMSQDMANVSSCIFPALTKFDIRNALPGLQHDFCVLFTEAKAKVQKAPNNNILLLIYFWLLRLNNKLNHNFVNFRITFP
jgi:hypothetical protein